MTTMIKLLLILTMVLAIVKTMGGLASLSWWWITAPITGLLAFIAACVALVGVINLVVWLGERLIPFLRDIWNNGGKF